MPYKKGSLAEQMGKQRRRIKNRIARFQREIDKTDSAKEKVMFSSLIEQLQKEVAKTYQRNPLTFKATGYSEDTIKIAAKNLERMEANTKLGQGAQTRKNFMTQQSLNVAVSGRFIGPAISEFSREEVNIFYTATRHAWEGIGSTENRNEAILKYYFGEKWKTKDLRKFVKFILSANKEAVASAESGYLPVYDDEGKLPKQTDQNEYYQEYIAKVNYVDRNLFELIKEEFESFDPDE